MTPERAAQRAVVQWARMVLPPGSIVQAVENAQRALSDDPGARARYGAARKASGFVTGFPDLLCVLPGGKCVFIEMKAPKSGVLSEAQVAMIERIRANGHVVFLASGIESARAGFREAGIPLRESADAPVAEAHVRVAKPRVTAAPGHAHRMRMASKGIMY